MDLRKTQPAKHLTAIRILASLPLILIGAQHLLGTAPMLPILVGAGIPMAEFMAWFAPAMEVVAGLALLLGLYARLGAIVAMVIMAVAVYSHIVHDWADEPILILPIAVFLFSAQILWGGGGAFSNDLAVSRSS